MVCYFILSKEEEFAWLRLRKQMFYIREWILFFQDKHDIVSKWHKLMLSSFRLPYAPYAVAKLNHHFRQLHIKYGIEKCMNRAKS